MGGFLLPLPAFNNFVGNKLNLTILNVTGLEENQINNKRLEEMGGSNNIRSKNICHQK